MIARHLLVLAMFAGCGANEPAAEPAREVTVEAREEAPAERPEPARPPEEPPEAPPSPPSVVEAGAQLGAIRIGMTEAEVRALGLPESEADPRSRRFGPYQVFFEGGSVRRIEAAFGELGRVRIGERTLEPGTHIHEIRDAIGDCEWTEGGGERYRCGGGRLLVHTDHTLDPQRYRFVVERRD